MTRVAIQLPQDLLDVARRRARETGRTLSGLISDALLVELREPLETKGARNSLPLCSGNGLQHGVDLSDADALEDLMRGLP